MAFGNGLEGGYGAASSVIHPDASHSGFVSVPDAELLFTADFGRKGPDLVLTGHDGRHHIIPGYFSTETHAALRAPNGASLAADVVELLAGSPAPGQYAQAQQTAAPEVIGKLEKVSGNVTVLRNGVSIALNVGDAVYKSDVVQTGANSSAGIGFPDGTALNLIANTRMALNEYVYDSSSTSNAALFTLVQGTFAFVAGKVAHSGDMKIATPVATMGIRGTTGMGHQLSVSEIAALNSVATITSNFGNVTYSFTIIDDFGVSTHGLYDLVRNNNVVSTVSDTTLMSYLDEEGHLATLPMTDSQLAFERALIDELFDVIRLMNVLPRSIPGVPGSPEAPTEQLPPQFIPPVNNQQPFAINLQFTTPNGVTETIFIDFTPVPPNNNNGNNNNNNGNTNPPPDTSNDFIWISSGPNTWDTGPGWQAGTLPTRDSHVIIDSQYSTVPDTVLPGEHFTISSLTVNGIGAILHIEGGSLTVLNGVTVTNGGEIIVDSNSIDPKLVLDGTVTVDGGEIESVGRDAHVFFRGPSVTNDDGGLILAKDQGHVVFHDRGASIAVFNLLGGTIEARHGGAVKFKDAGVVNDGGRIEAAGCGSSVEFKHGTVINEPASTGETTAGGIIVARNRGTIDFYKAEVTNDGGIIKASDRGFVTFTEGSVTNENGGKIVARHDGTVDFTDTTVDNDGGKVEASGCDSTVNLAGATIIGGKVGSRDGGIVQAVSGCNTFDAVTITACSTIRADCFATLALVGLTTIDGLVTFEGPGTFTLDGKADHIVGDGAGSTLVNDSLIVGIGKIGAGADKSDSLALINCGTIEARGGELVIHTGIGAKTDSSHHAPTTTNFGLLEADGKNAILLIEQTTVENYGKGAIAAFNDDGAKAKTASVVELDGAHIIGGKLESSHHGTIEVLNDGSASSFENLTNDASVVVDSGATLILRGTIENNGNIVIDQEYLGADLVIDGHVKLKGTGVVKLEGAGDAIVGGNHGGTLDNFSTISGFGSIGIGDCDLTLVNKSSGVIKADDSATPLIIDTGHNHIANTGLLEAKQGGALDIDSDVDNKGGIIAAYGGGSTVQLSDVTIKGGTLATGDPYWHDLGVIEVVQAECANVSILDGCTDKVTVDGFVQVEVGAQLELKGTIDNHGTIDVYEPDFGCPSEGSTLLIDGKVVLKGPGAVTLDGNATEIAGVGCGATLDNYSDILGAGQIGVGGKDLTLVNEAGALIDAIGGILGPIVIDTGCNLVTNAGTMEATGGSTLDIYSDVDNKNGTIAASVVEEAPSADLTPPSFVKLYNVTIKGGTLATDTGFPPDSGSMIEIMAPGGSDTSTFDGAGQKVTIDGYVQIEQGANLELIGTIDNHGTIDVDCGPAAGADLIISGTVHLKGGGTVTLDGSGDDITGVSCARLDNVNNTISGAGQIGTGDLKLDNEAGGTIEATGLLVLDTGHTICNAGFIDVAVCGALDVFDSNIDNTGSNPGASHNPTGILVAGTLEVDSDEPLTLTGGGQIDIAGGTIEGFGHSGSGPETYTLENVDNTIFGYGTISHGDSDLLSLTNDCRGTIDANASGQTLTLDTGTTIHNLGLLEASNHGTLHIDDDVCNVGTLEADGGTLFVACGATITGCGSALITGGGLADFAGAFNQDVTFSGAGTLALAQCYSGTISGFGVSDAIDLTNIAYSTEETVCRSQADGTLTIRDGGDIVDVINLLGCYSANDFSLVQDSGTGTEVVFGDEWTGDVSGKWHEGANWSDGTPTSENAVIDLAGAYTVTTSGTTAALSLTIGDTDATLSGSGTLSIPTIDNNGTIDVVATKTMEITGAITGDGTLDIESKATLQLDDASSNTVNYEANHGTLVLDGTSGTFTGAISGFGGHDVIDLASFDYNSDLSISFHNHELTVGDSGESISIAFKGSYNSSNFEFAPDSSGTGVEITFDANDPSVMPGTSNVVGDLSFAAPNAADSYSASFTPQGSGYSGIFLLDPMKIADGGGTVDFEFMPGKDQINLASGQTVTQTYGVSVSDGHNTVVNQNVSISIGGPGNDNFVFHPGIGTDTIVNFNPQSDTIELDGFDHAQSIQQLASHIATDAHGDAVIDLGHHDSITLPGMTGAQLQQVLQSVVHLH